MKRLLGKLFLWLFRWKINPTVPKEVHGQCVMICAPHTSNWDFPIAVSAMAALRVKIRYTIKKEWMRFPFGWFFQWMGAIGINRKPKKEGEERESMVQVMADLFKTNKELCLMVPAEGSRSLRKQWKTGFYYVALAASVPIVMAYLDYSKKDACIGKVLYPTGDLNKDMYEIMEFYKDIKGKFPEKFALDERYYPEPVEKLNG